MPYTLAAAGDTGLLSGQPPEGNTWDSSAQAVAFAPCSSLTRRIVLHDAGVPFARLVSSPHITIPV